MKAYLTSEPMSDVTEYESAIRFANCIPIVTWSSVIITTEICERFPGNKKWRTVSIKVTDHFLAISNVKITDFPVWKPFPYLCY